MSLLEVRHLKKVYTTRFGGNQVEALRNVNFTVEAGEYVAIMGESGSGKTTLLNILAALDKPTAGEVLLSGKSLETIPERDLAAFRRDNLGFVFQEFNLLDTFPLRTISSCPWFWREKVCRRCSRPCCPWPNLWASRTSCTSSPMRYPAARSSVPPWPGP